MRNNPDFDPTQPKIKPVKFHHLKLVRRNDLEAKKKQKKLEWLRKMYEGEMHRCRLELGLTFSWYTTGINWTS